MDTPFLPLDEPPRPPLTGTARLAHWGVIRARGEDAVKFLQGQLTNDIASMQADEARLAGFCSAKGRLQASFIVWSDGSDEVLLACAASLLAPTLKRLSMFVLRARCRLSDASAELPLVGCVEPVGTAGNVVPDDIGVWRTAAVAGGPRTIRLPDAAGHRRAIQIGELPDGGLRPGLPLDAWRWLEVQSGIATIEDATVDRFVPQMLNYELIGGVDFRKGCYPGQEVVARSQYRGTVKRRSFLFDIDAPAAPGQEVFVSGLPDQPVGMVVNAAPRPAAEPAGCSALVEVQLAVWAGPNSLHLGGSDGPLLQRRELPYPLPWDSADAAA